MKVTPLLCAALLLSACGGRRVPGLDGAGPSNESRPASDRDARGREAGLKRDADTSPCGSGIGRPCATDSGCCAGLSCVALVTGRKVCTRTCVPDDPSTALVNEDNCSDVKRYTCSQAATSGKGLVCLARCTPALGQASCAQGLACDPRSDALTGVPGQAVCAYPACQSGKDCPVYLSEKCASGASCTSSPPGAFCVPAAAGATSGTCALAGVCDPTSGLCAAHGLGTASAKVGAPCADDRACAGSMRCDGENGSGATIHARNGYCLVEGCSFEKSLPGRACPAGSTCQHKYPGGRCLRICSLTLAADCRGLAADKHGDYECYSWTNLSYVGVHVADSPTCEPADGYPCAKYGPPSKIACPHLGIPAGNATEMRCRDRSTGQALPDGTPGGLCLDTTASGS